MIVCDLIPGHARQRVLTQTATMIYTSCGGRSLPRYETLEVLLWSGASTSVRDMIMRSVVLARASLGLIKSLSDTAAGSRTSSQIYEESSVIGGGCS